MKASQVSTGTAVRVRWGAASIGKSQATGDGTVPAIVLSVRRGSVILQVQVPGERTPRELTLGASDGQDIPDLLPA